MLLLIYLNGTLYLIVLVDSRGTLYISTDLVYF